MPHILDWTGLNYGRIPCCSFVLFFVLFFVVLVCCFVVCFLCSYSFLNLLCFGSYTCVNWNIIAICKREPGVFEVEIYRKDGKRCSEAYEAHCQYKYRSIIELSGQYEDHAIVLCPSNEFCGRPSQQGKHVTSKSAHDDGSTSLIPSTWFHLPIHGCEWISIGNFCRSRSIYDEFQCCCRNNNAEPS